jgi:hypothetical protein
MLMICVQWHMCALIAATPILHCIVQNVSVSAVSLPGMSCAVPCLLQQPCNTWSDVLLGQDSKMLQLPCDILSVVLPEQDLKNIEAGVYKLPWDMTTLRNKQYDPLHLMRTALTFASEASSTMHRRMRGSPDRVWLDSSMYPSYYLNTFHYQVTMELASYMPAVMYCLTLFSFSKMINQMPCM